MSDTEREQQDVAKTRSVAIALFPGEEWVRLEERIFVAASRLSGGFREQAKWERELAQVKILTRQGSVAYFLPDRIKGGRGEICADLVLDGSIMEMKTVSGTRETLGSQFKYGR
jgi:hypothetical protein